MSPVRGFRWNGTDHDLRDIHSSIYETGLLELVDKDDEVNTNDYSATADFAIGETASGELLSFMFVASEVGSGAVQDSAGKLLIFDADPNTTAGDTALAAAGAEHKTLVGVVSVAASDWITDTAGGAAFIYNQPVPFHEVSTLHFVWLHTDATDLNDAAGDDEELHVNAWYRRDS